MPHIASNRYIFGGLFCVRKNGILQFIRRIVSTFCCMHARAYAIIYGAHDWHHKHITDARLCSVHILAACTTHCSRNPPTASEKCERLEGAYNGTARIHSRRVTHMRLAGWLLSRHICFLGLSCGGVCNSEPESEHANTRTRLFYVKVRYNTTSCTRKRRAQTFNFQLSHARARVRSLTSNAHDVLTHWNYYYYYYMCIPYTMQRCVRIRVHVSAPQSHHHHNHCSYTHTYYTTHTKKHLIHHCVFVCCNVECTVVLPLNRTHTHEHRSIHITTAYSICGIVLMMPSMFSLYPSLTGS